MTETLIFENLNNFVYLRNLLLTNNFFILSTDSPEVLERQDLAMAMGQNGGAEIIFGAKKIDATPDKDLVIETKFLLIKKTERVREYFVKAYDIYDFEQESIFNNLLLLNISTKRKKIELYLAKSEKPFSFYVDEVIGLLEKVFSFLLELTTNQ